MDFGLPPSSRTRSRIPVKAKRLGTEDPYFGDPDSVVSYLYDQGTGFPLQAHLHLRRRGMAHDIRQALLNDGGRSPWNGRCRRSYPLPVG